MKEELLTALSILNKLGKMETEITKTKFPKDDQREINYLIIKIRNGSGSVINSPTIKKSIKLYSQLISEISKNVLIEVFPASDDADYRLKTGRFTEKQF